MSNTQYSLNFKEGNETPVAPSAFAEQLTGIIDRIEQLGDCSVYVVVCLECVRLGQWLVKRPPLMEMSPVSLPDSSASLTPMAHSGSVGPSVDTDAGVSQAGVFTKKVLSQ